MNLSGSITLSGRPLKDIVLNREDLLQHAIDIAKSHVHIGKGRKQKRLLPRVYENIRFIQIAHHKITDYVQKTNYMVPAAEWFLDNYYIIKDLKTEIQRSLPAKYENQLPRLANGDYEGYPRIYVLLVELVKHTDSQLNKEILKDFVDSYQSHVSLTSGELWAIPIMLRIVLLENIRRLVEQILFTQNEREDAERWIAPFLKIENNFGDFDELLNRSVVPKEYSPAYADHLAKRIRDLGVDGLPILRWLDRIVAKQDTTIENLAKLEHQRLAASQVSMGYAITSLRYLGEEGWPRFFEEISLVEKVLVRDPSGIYPQMDFDSRDEYRHQVEKLAKQFRISELVVARKVLERAQQAADRNEYLPSHVGYDLLGEGRRQLERELEKDWGVVRQSWCEFKRLIKKKPLVVYLGSILIIIALIYYGISQYLSAVGMGNTILLLLLVLGLLFPVGSISIGFTNWLVSKLISPTFFPKLELRDGIPEELRTMVVIPTLLNNQEKVKELIEKMEIYYLANKDNNLHFAVLGDFTDALSDSITEDKVIIEAAINGINALNSKYESNRFFLFNRKRLWNNSEGLWMGWERKRGKLIEFNRLLRQSAPTSYDVQVGALSVLPSIRYVITLDSDTELPRDTAKKLIGTLAHPLHIAQLNTEETRVIKGYGILQPRIGVSVFSAGASFFSQIFSGKVGIDPYTTAVSDVYQDLFNEGIFTGKGIYDVDVFHKVTDKAFPENTILSHDLIEGIYARAGLVTDIELVDGFPAKYHASIRRLHRWIRGDWQLLPWLFKPLPFISKWKILDNLRRSLEMPAQFLLILLAFSLLPGSPWLWSGIVALNLLWPLILNILSLGISNDSTKVSTKQERRDFIVQAFLQFVFIPYQAYTQLDAIFRSLSRQFVTHRKMLEWETAADVEKRLGPNLSTFWHLMWPSVLVIPLYVLLLAIINRSNVWLFIPIGLLWVTSPWFAYKISLPAQKVFENLTVKDQQELRFYARKIWAFFEEYVSAEDNWLPPDNVQIDPPNGIAHRTSPTNIGLALLANLGARDFGYISINRMLERISNTLQTIDKLDHWQGHLFNWYDTKTLQPLRPHYISTVDSGNYVLYLITLKTGIHSITAEPVISLKLLSGLSDTLNLFKDSMPDETLPEFEVFINTLNYFIEQEELDLQSWIELLSLWPFKRNNQNFNKDAEYWLEHLDNMIKAFRDETEEFFPWLYAKSDLSIQDKEKLKSINIFLTLIDLKQEYRKIYDHCSYSLQELLFNAINNIQQIIKVADDLEQRLYSMALSIDFKPLFDQNRQLFSIGYRIEEGLLDKSYYDLLASEARQASFIAIAKGDIPQSHWFRLGRSLTKVGKIRSLVSWSGTMFEFLMPLLVMHNYEGTLLNETYQSVVKVQQDFGISKEIPWGISESGFYAFDTQFNYQYKAFGVPGLGLKRGLAQELVIAPYATFLALLIAPGKALKNIRKMSSLGFEGRFGLYEAVDYTTQRVPLSQKYRIVKSFMAHHQGMSFISLVNLLNDNIMQNRFHEDVIVQATDLLLQERIPEETEITPQPEEPQTVMSKKTSLETEGQRFLTISTADTLMPLTHFISNDLYSVMLTNSGSGYSRLGSTAITRWREDVTCDNWGMYFYIQNLNAGNVWSATHQPCGYSGEDYKVTYAPDRVEFQRKDGNIVTRTEIVVSPEDQVEIRRICLTNRSQHDRVIEITSYLEVVLASPSQDSAHPAFSNLFIKTEFQNNSLLANRRPRQVNQGSPWLMHTIATEGESIGILQYETDRARFIGRGRSLAKPLALEPNHPLSNSVGAILDPIMSLRQRVRIKPGETAKIAYSVGYADSREDVIELANKYRDYTTVSRAFELAWTHSQMELRHLGLSTVIANRSLLLAGQLLYLSPSRKEAADKIKNNNKGQSSLWPYAISGDMPIVLVTIKSMEQLDLIRSLLSVHEYWRLKGIQVDLVIINEDKSGYVQSLQDSIRDLISMGHARDRLNQSSGIFLFQKDNIDQDDLNLLYSVARLTFSDQDGSFSFQIRKKNRMIASRVERHKSQFKTLRKTDYSFTGVKTTETIPEGKLYRNGYGGFTEDGREYIIELNNGMNTPLPWINVIANPFFGFQISSTGSGYTWSQNSRENKLTTWSNDPIIDPLSELLYLRDEETGDFWSVTPEPIRQEGKYSIRHGQGYSFFHHCSNSIEQEMLVYVPVNKPLKIIRLKLHNLSGIERHLTATYYAEWVLGVSREVTTPFLVSEYDTKLETLLIRNTYQEEFSNRLAFLTGLGADVRSYTGDRTEFIGRNGSLNAPAGLEKSNLSGTTGAGLDPCSALQLILTLQPGEEKTIYYLLGECTNKDDIENLANYYHDSNNAEQDFKEVRHFWDDLLGTIQVQTPDDSLNLLFNRWLLYQTVVCRLWARSAFYQSGGAYGFRDQLQDVMALSVNSPELTREQIIRHCAHQFIEGDVQHWWHNEKGKGIRTKFSDDFLWLPFVTADYLEHTEDYSLLEERIPFLEDVQLKEEEDERYSIPRISEEDGTVYEHCIRAIEHGLRFGEHGLPLIGTGDWNDGFSSIGRLGKGESVWLGWFLYLTLMRFAQISEHYNDKSRAEKFRDIALELKENIERNGWDGGWYRRAYFDDGTPLGSAQNDECQIDAIAQAWSVISGAAKLNRTQDAMLALEHYLWRKDEGILLLLTPPFHNSEPDPGYIKGYVPGVRENGGQYTHGAIWAVLALTMMKEGDKAFELFQMLNPINHSRTESEAAKYKVEPYVMSADVYAISPNIGRGGWTWYTGAAGWMYQTALEGILGFKLTGNKLSINPCIPKSWKNYRINYRYKSTQYNILVENPAGKMSGIAKITEDDKIIKDSTIILVDDGKNHEIKILM